MASDATNGPADSGMPGGSRGRVESISGVTLAVRDMAAAVAFYDSLGFNLLHGGADAPFTSYGVSTGFVNLQLDPAWMPGDRVWGRTIFWVDDVDSMYARAIQAGHSPSTEPADAPWGERYFHLLDPDGHELSFARPLS